MANYDATIRTNYFAVKDAGEFRKLIHSVSAEDEVHIFEQAQPDGSKKLGFGCYGNIYGIPVKPDEDDSEPDINCFYNGLQRLVRGDDAIIITEVGSEKLRYAIGCSTVITSKEIQCVSIPDDALHLAQKLLGNKDFQTQMDY